MKKIRKILVLLMLMFVFNANMVISFAYAEPEVEQNNLSEPQNIQPRYDVLEWHYKTVDGKLYKRLFNKTTGKWVGEWTLC